MKKRLHRLYRDCILVLWDSLIISMIAISHLLALSPLLEVTPKYLDLIQNCFLSRRYNAHNFLPFSAASKIWPISLGSVNCTQAGRTHEDTSFIFTSLARNWSSIIISRVGFPQYVGSTERENEEIWESLTLCCDQAGAPRPRSPSQPFELQRYENKKSARESSHYNSDRR